MAKNVITVFVYHIEINNNNDIHKCQFFKVAPFQTSENKKRNALRFLNYLSYILFKTVNLMYIVFIF